MKKLLFVALFTLAITVNATGKNEVVTNNFKEVKVENSDISKELKTGEIELNREISEESTLLGCGSKANLKYKEYRGSGYSHREARSLRRSWVRKCRGGTWAWLIVSIFAYGTI